jgi:hypothetical protein
LHPLDFLGGEDVPELAFFPAMNLPASRKLAFVGQVLDLYARSFRVVPMSRHVQEAFAGRVTIVDPEMAAVNH